MTDERAMKARDTSRQIQGSTADLVKATKSNELQSTHRVMVKEWLPTFKNAEQSVVTDFFDKKFEGRVRDEDVKYDFDEEQELYTLDLRLWNVKAEWKDESLAWAHHDELLNIDPDLDVEIVGRNSRKEHMLNGYGKLKLPAVKK